jgi:hypothetical protein
MFNKALLAKQVWRIHQHPESLVAQIFIAKYFSQGSVLEASLRSWPSYVWWSLVSAQELLKQGLVR